MNKEKITHIHKSRSDKKDLPSAVDDAADVMSKYSKNSKGKKDQKYSFPEIDYEKPPHYQSFLLLKKFFYASLFGSHITRFFVLSRLTSNLYLDCSSRHSFIQFLPSLSASTKTALVKAIGIIIAAWTNILVGMLYPIYPSQKIAISPKEILQIVNKTSMKYVCRLGSICFSGLNLTSMTALQESTTNITNRLKILGLFITQFALDKNKSFVITLSHAFTKSLRNFSLESLAA